MTLGKWSGPAKVLPPKVLPIRTASFNQHIELMAKDENFGLQRCARPQQPGHCVPDQLEEITHRGDYQPIRQ